MISHRCFAGGLVEKLLLIGFIVDKTMTVCNVYEESVFEMQIMTILLHRMETIWLKMILLSPF